MRFVSNPVFALRNISPSPDKGETFGQGVDIAFAAVNPGNLGGKPIGRHLPFAQKLEYLHQKRGMIRAGQAPEIRHAADIPKQAHILRAAHMVADFRDRPQSFQRRDVIGIARTA